jgi:hypothetical protein
MTTGESLPGFLAVAAQNRKQLLSYDVFVAAGTAAAVGWFVPVDELRGSLVDLIAIKVTAVAALFALTVAGITILVAFLDRQWVAVAESTPAGVMGDLFAFWFLAWLCGASLLMSGTLLLLHQLLVDTAFRVLAGLGVFLAVYAVLAAINLVGLLVLQGSNRAKLISRES